MNPSPRRLPEAVDEAGAKRPDDLKSLQAARATWKAVGNRSPIFKNWFGDWEKAPTSASKVVDATGKPLVVYHGSPALANGGGFDAFHVPASAGDLLAGRGVYLTDSKPIAQSYTLNRDELLSGGSADGRNMPASTPVLPLYANIRKALPGGRRRHGGRARPRGRRTGQAADGPAVAPKGRHRDPAAFGHRAGGAGRGQRGTALPAG